MKIITLIFMTAVAAYNLLGDNDSIYWREVYFMAINITLTVAFYKFWRQEVLRTRVIYFSGMVLSIFYTLFQFVLLSSHDIATYLGRVNSVLWSLVSFLIILISLCYDYYYKRKIS